MSSFFLKKKPNTIIHFFSSVSIFIDCMEDTEPYHYTKHRPVSEAKDLVHLQTCVALYFMQFP